MKSHFQYPSRRVSGRRAFTLVELLVSMAVLSVIMLVTMSALETMQRSWRETRGKVNQFREARIAFETITRNLSQATLNPYWDYYYTQTGSNVPPSESTVSPAGYIRQSELDFRVGRAAELAGAEASEASHPGHSLFFQAPLGLSQHYRGLGSLLNARGYYIRFGSDESRRPAFLPGQKVPAKKRYQLMEYRPPAEKNAQQEGELQGNTVYQNNQWYAQDAGVVSRPIADNILLLVISPQVPEETAAASGRKKSWLAPTYRYQSRDADNSTPALDGPQPGPDGTLDQGTQHLLPPLVKVTLVAGEEATMKRWLDENRNEPMDLLSLAEAPFTEAQHYDRDLGRLKAYLDSLRLNYRVFTTTVTLRNAAWDSSTF